MIRNIEIDFIKVYWQANQIFGEVKIFYYRYDWLYILCIMYTHARGLRSIGDYNLKPPQQIFSIDSNVNLPCDNNFIYWLIW